MRGEELAVGGDEAGLEHREKHGTLCALDRLKPG